MLLVSAVGLVFLSDLFFIALDGEREPWQRILSGLTFLVVLGAVWLPIKEAPKLERKVEQLEDEVLRLEGVISALGGDYFELLRNKLRAMADQLEFDGADRISVYRYDDGQFTMVGRYAERPEFDKPGRTIYPANQGVIGTAWSSADGYSSVADLPDARTEWANYRDVNNKVWKLPMSVVDSLNMRSRSIAAHVLKHPTTSARNAIIVFESEAPNRFDNVDLKSRCTGAWGQETSQFLESMRSREPDLKFAKTRGF